METIELYVDGACSNNIVGEGIGGYAIVNSAGRCIFSKGALNTTNNRMELLAVKDAIQIGLDLLSTFDKYNDIIIYSDSAYVVNIVNDWMYGWAKKGWVTSKNETPKNLDIIKAMYELMVYENRVSVQKVKGHSSNELNNIADVYAVKAKEAMK